ncbi:DUF6544 family protein [Rhizobacter sp. Root16D2]|uniref:DUF6920 family protein n=1 Tax=Rhizobacter sp. Root16D2 TaxID=1736479 RepID=UPI000701BC43|nr:DUF6544 family protein [Rhizobacter sp. Root16D2]KRB14688.1 hypothetical protein ASE08_09710 [Rhizobacter sp. Root16D2]
MADGHLLLAAVVLLPVGALFALSVVGAARWRHATRRLMRRLDAARRPIKPAHFDARELEDLPAPVQRYFRTVLVNGQAMVTSVYLGQQGRIDLGETEPRWKPFTATQRITTQAPGFVWDSSVALLPGLKVRVHDAYLAGSGILRPAALGLFTLGTPPLGDELAEGELMRFLAEAVWYPTALLPSQGVAWTPVDARSARATLIDGGQRVNLLFRFGGDGLIESVRADARGRTEGGKLVPTPWEGRWWNATAYNGMLLPMDAEVSWHLPAGLRAYWRGTVTHLTCEFET